MNDNLQTLSLISGKGGSGKTIIAISIAKVLNDSGYKVLLVDCDNVTHGASYFFEDELETPDSEINSLEKFIHGVFESEDFIKTKTGFYFLPSSESKNKFQPNKQLDINIEGSGLGLFISKEIIDLHGGTIWAESEGRNKGATFKIKLFKDNV